MVFEYVEKTLLQVLEENPDGLDIKSVRLDRFAFIEAWLSSFGTYIYIGHSLISL